MVTERRGYKGSIKVGEWGVQTFMCKFKDVLYSIDNKSNVL